MKWLIVNMLLLGAAFPAAGADDRPLRDCAQGNDGEFKLVREKGGVTLYERWIEIEPGLKVRELKAQFVSDAGPETLLSLLKDVNRAHRWMQSMQDFKMVETGSSSSWTSYTKYSIPWPLEDQDIVIRYQTTSFGGGYFASYQSITHASYPAKEGVTRMKGVSGSWQFQPKTNGQTQVTYLIMTKNRSTMPRWMTDPIIQDNLLDTMNAFNAQANELHAQR